MGGEQPSEQEILRPFVKERIIKREKLVKALYDQCRKGIGALQNRPRDELFDTVLRDATVILSRIEALDVTISEVTDKFEEGFVTEIKQQCQGEIWTK